MEQQVSNTTVSHSVHLETLQPRSFPEVENPQNWQNMVVAADLAYAARELHRLEADSHVKQPLTSAGAAEQTAAEAQTLIGETQRSASTVAIRQPSVTVESKGSQISLAPELIVRD